MQEKNQQQSSTRDKPLKNMLMYGVSMRCDKNSAQIHAHSFTSTNTKSKVVIFNGAA